MSETQTYEARLKTDYKARIRAAMQEKFGYTNPMQIPRLDKIVINMGVGESVADSKKKIAKILALRLSKCCQCCFLFLGARGEDHAADER